MSEGVDYTSRQQCQCATSMVDLSRTIQSLLTRWAMEDSDQRDAIIKAIEEVFTMPSTGRGKWVSKKDPDCAVEIHADTISLLKQPGKKLYEHHEELDYVTEKLKSAAIRYFEAVCARAHYVPTRHV